MKAIAIITARGGSKRIPGKNIKDFHGKPIIAYSIEAALNSNLFDEVMVSTDSEEIAFIAKKYGASIPFMRSEINSNDYAGTVDVLIEVLNEYSHKDKIFDHICCIYPTAPFVTSEKLAKSLELLVTNEYESVVVVTAYSTPSQWALKRENSGHLVPLNPESKNVRSQDLEKTYYDVGQFYWATSNCVIKEKSLLTNNTGGFVVDELETQDIDNESDWLMAELKYQLFIKSEQTKNSI